MALLVLIPALDLEGTIGPLLGRIREVVPGGEILVVDDGSADGTAREARAVDRVRVISHGTNRGKGAALRTGFAVALEEGLDPVITLDGDGQHPPELIPRFLARAREGEAAIVVGSRPRRGSPMPLHRRCSNRLLTWIASRAAGTSLPDSQSGYRLIRSHVLEEVPLRTERYETETELLVGAARRGFRIDTIPVPAVYGEERSHIRAWKDAALFARLFWSLHRGE